MKLSLDRDRIDRAKHLAEQIVNPVQHFIDRHTTESIERCVLRLLGVSGPRDPQAAKSAPQGNQPLINAVTDALGPKRLGRGAGYWLGLAACHFPKLGVNDLAKKIAADQVPWDQVRGVTLKQIDQACQNFLQPQLNRFRSIREDKRRRPHWEQPSLPLRYVIVATGNIHEDIKQAQVAAQMGADIIAVIRSTAQSLLDYVPEGATTEGYGGTYATQENFRLMRQALDEVENKMKRKVALCNYSSGLCMPEIAVIGALEGVDYLLNDAMYGILFRDINMKRNFVDQYFSRRICALSGITIQTGEDNYLTTAESNKYWYQVLASHFINQAFARRAGVPDSHLSLGHAFEMDPHIEDSILMEWAQAQLVRELFPRSPIKFMPPTKHKNGDIFFSYLYDGMFNLAGAITGQTIQLLGMHTEAIHNPHIQDRFLSLKSAKYIFQGAKNAKNEITFHSHGKIARRARQVLDDAVRLLGKVKMRGMLRAIEEGAFANVRRSQGGGKGLEGVIHQDRDYYTPLADYLTPRALKEASEEGRDRGGRRRSGPQARRGSSRGGDRRPARGRKPDRKPRRSPSQREERSSSQGRRSKSQDSRQNQRQDTRQDSRPDPRQNQRRAPSSNRRPPASEETQPHPQEAKVSSPAPSPEDTQPMPSLPRRELKTEESAQDKAPTPEQVTIPEKAPEKSKEGAPKKPAAKKAPAKAPRLPRRSLKAETPNKDGAPSIPRRPLKTEPSPPRDPEETQKVPDNPVGEGILPRRKLPVDEEN